jgi:hypothetical protein
MFQRFQHSSPELPPITREIDRIPARLEMINSLSSRFEPKLEKQAEVASPRCAARKYRSSFAATRSISKTVTKDLTSCGPSHFEFDPRRRPPLSHVLSVLRFAMRTDHPQRSASMAVTNRDSGTNVHEIAANLPRQHAHRHRRRPGSILAISDWVTPTGG